MSQSTPRSSRTMTGLSPLLLTTLVALTRRVTGLVRTYHSPFVWPDVSVTHQHAHTFRRSTIPHPLCAKVPRWTPEHPRRGTCAACPSQEHWGGIQLGWPFRPRVSSWMARPPPGMYLRNRGKIGPRTISEYSMWLCRNLRLDRSCYHLPIAGNQVSVMDTVCVCFVLTTMDRSASAAIAVEHLFCVSLVSGGRSKRRCCVVTTK